MKTNQSKTAILTSPVKKGVLGGLLILLSISLFGVIAALCVTQGILPEQGGVVTATVIRISSFFLGTVLTGGMVEKGKLQAGAVAVTIGLFFLVMLTVLAWDGAFVDFWLSAFGSVLGGAAGVLLSMLPKNKKRVVGKRYR